MIYSNRFMNRKKIIYLQYIYFLKLTMMGWCVFLNIAEVKEFMRDLWNWPMLSLKANY